MNSLFLEFLVMMLLVMFVMIGLAFITQSGIFDPDYAYHNAMQKFADNRCKENGYDSGNYWGGQLNEEITIREYINCTKQTVKCTPDGQCFPTTQTDTVAVEDLK